MSFFPKRPLPRKIVIAIVAFAVVACLLVHVAKKECIKKQGKADGYDQGYIAGQEDSAAGNPYYSVPPTFPDSYFADDKADSFSRKYTYHNYFKLTWPSGYYAGYHGLMYYNDWKGE